MVPEAAHDLFALDPDEFVAARDALAKELRSSGDREVASEVKKLRRPAVAVWALNQVARRDPDAVAELRAATDAAKEPGDLRAALARRRDAVKALGRAARAVLAERGRASDAQDRAVEDALNAIASSDELLTQLADGVLSSVEAEVPMDDLLATMAASTAAPAQPARTGPSPELVAAREELARREREASAAERELDEARLAVADAERTHRDALDALERARADVERHERES